MTTERGSWLTTEPEEAFSQVITKPQRKKLISWLLENGASQSDSAPGPRQARLGELTEVFSLEGEPVLIHTRPNYQKPGNTSVRLDCSKKVAKYLMEDSIISKPVKK